MSASFRDGAASVKALVGMSNEGVRVAARRGSDASGQSGRALRRSLTLAAITACLWLYGGCGYRTTELGLGAGRPMVAPAPDVAAGPTLCRAEYGDGGGGPLVEPPSDCVRSFSQCGDDRTYQVLCDGLFCDCLFDGWPTGGFLTPRCAGLTEMNLACGWAVGIDGFSGGPPIRGEPCSDDSPAFALGTSCTCDNGIVKCPTPNGCELAGEWRSETGLRLVVQADGVLWVSENSAASLGSIEDGAHPGYYGTWQLDDERFSLRAIHNAPGCEDVTGRYQLHLDAACSKLELELLDDACAERAGLAAAPLLRVGDDGTQEPSPAE